MNTHIVIMAGGVGSRFWPLSTPELPKQFIDILGCGRTLIQLTVDRFKGICSMQKLQQCSEIDAIELVCVDGFQKTLQKIADDNGITKVIRIVTGGKDYEHSIQNGVEGLKGIAKDEDVVQIHWAASPFVSDEILKDNIRVCKEKGNAMSSCKAFVLYGTNDGDHAAGIIDRDTFMSLSAPQAFLYKNIVEFYRQVEELHLFDTVEAHTTSLMAALNMPIYFSKGDQTNIKITTHCRDETFLINDREIHLIDWEYAGFGDPGFNIGSYVCGGDHSEEEVDRILFTYFGRKPSLKEQRHFYAYIGITGFFYMHWTMFKESQGQKVGYLKPLWYHFAKEYSKKALPLYNE